MRSLSDSTNVEVVQGNSDRIEAVLTGKASEKYVDRLDLKITNENGKLLIEPVRARYQAARLSFDSGSGNVKLPDGTGELAGQGDSGNITVEAEALKSNTRLKAGSGNVTIQVNGQPPSLAFEFAADSGDCKVDWPYTTLQRGQQSENHRSGKFGEGEVQLNAVSGSGNIKLIQR